MVRDHRPDHGVRSQTKYPLTNRRTVLKGLGIGVVGVGGATGITSAHHVQDIVIEDVPDTVVAGEPFSCKVHWRSGHGASACFISAVNYSGWTQCGKDTQTAASVGEHRHFQLSSTVPRSIEPDTYTFRVSASEAYYRCPEPGECGFPILCADAPDGGTVEVIPPVKVADVSFRGCSELWVAFEKFPVDSTTVQVNVNGNWDRVTIKKAELTKIPGQYGDRPVFKYSVSGNDKVVGLRIVGERYMNDNRCAQNI